MSGLTKLDVEQTLDYVLHLAQDGAAKTKIKFDDMLVSWAIAGRDGWVKVICRMFGIQDGPAPAPVLAVLPMHGVPTLASLGIDDPAQAGLSGDKLRLLQFILNLLHKWIGPVVPVPTPSE